MKTVAIKHIAVFAALVLSSAANAATYDYTAHYDYVRKPSLTDADTQLQGDTVTCDSTVGVQRATPSASYRGCMLQHGWKYGFLTRKTVQVARAPADPYFSSNAKVALATSSIMTTAWTARTPAAPKSAFPPTGWCAISTRIRICPARVPVRWPFAQICKSLARADRRASDSVRSRDSAPPLSLSKLRLRDEGEMAAIVMDLRYVLIRSRTTLTANHITHTMHTNLLSTPRQQELCGAMSKETQRSTDRFDWDVAAADALEQARLMAPGPERNEALKLASSLRCTADERGVVFAKRGRPRK